MDINLEKVKHMHFVGIGGVSMYLLALYCKGLGIEVSGSDVKASKYTTICKSKGIKVKIGHKRKNIAGADLVVYTGAIDNSNVEIVEAENKKIKTVDRSEFLSYICKKFKYVIGVSGTHGKSTTCAMIYHILRSAGKKVSCHIGADVKDARLNPNDEYLVLECCEYNRSFLKFNCDMAVVLNIDNDHLDCYGNMYNLRNAFKTFLKRAKTRVVLDNDTTSCIKNRAIRVKCKDIEGVNKFVYKDKRYAINNVYGKHNIYNAVVAVDVCLNLGLSYTKIYKALKSFEHVGRRCELLGRIGDCEVLTDYAHHPSEIECLYSSLQTKYNEVNVIFQPHTYSRTKILIKEFVRVLDNIKNLIIYKEYPAREDKCKGYSAKLLSQYVDNASYVKNYSQLNREIKGKFFEKGDCIVFVGAGDINKVAQKFVHKNGYKV